MSNKTLTDEELNQAIGVLSVQLGDTLAQNTPTGLDGVDRFTLVSSTLINVLSKYIAATATTISISSQGKVDLEKAAKDLGDMALGLLAGSIQDQTEFAVENIEEFEALAKTNDTKWN